jgi:putative nucleotidyltransferase with HDIG domain
MISPGKICENYIDFFKEANINHEIEIKLQNRSFLKELAEEIRKIKFRTDENQQLLKFLIYCYDFKSTSILSHSINVACYTTAIAKRCKLKKEQIDRLYTTALLHDIGKVLIPPHILDRAKKLDSNMITIVQEHVSQTKNILSGCIPEDMVETAYRHHERMDGSGYPQNLTAESLTLQQRILAIADIAGGITDSRTYKSSFPKEKSIRLLEQLASEGRIDKKITHILIQDFDKINAEVNQQHSIFASDYAKIMDEYNKDLDDVYANPLKINA